jgi:hypothetical protein
VLGLGVTDFYQSQQFRLRCKVAGHEALELIAGYRSFSYTGPNYGERYRHGEPITTSFVESTVNQVVSKRFCKRQQMQWSKRGAHLLLQARVKTLNREWAAVFKQWYPDIDIEEWDDAA